LAPVEPGNLLMLAYKDDVPIVSAPGCFRSAKPNVVDLILPPLLARYRVTSWEVTCLGHGGLLG
jgi:molybdenum cofactor cytidylyltransferase